MLLMPRFVELGAGLRRAGDNFDSEDSEGFKGGDFFIGIFVSAHDIPKTSRLLGFWV